MAEQRPKLTLNIRQPTADGVSPKQAVKAAAKRKQAATETMDDAWQRILSMKNSDADQRKLNEVRAAMAEGLIDREPSVAAKRFSKAEALRLYMQLRERQREETLRKMVEEMPDNYWLITDAAKLDEFLSLLADEKEIVFDVETTGTDVWSDYIVGHVISAVKADIHAYIPTKHKTDAKQLDNDFVLRMLKPYYEDENIGKIAHNARFDIHMLRNEGVELRGLTWDTQIAMHVLNENERFQGGSYQLKDLVTKYLKIPSQTYDELFGQRGFDEVSDLRVATAYAAKDGDVTLKLRDFQRFHLDKIGLLEYYETVENPTISVAIEMEQAGFVLDQERAKVLGKDLSEELTVIERGLREHFGEINFRSPTQLSEKFYGELMLNRHLPKGTKLSTDVKTLEMLAPHNQGIELLLQYREKSKLLGTYIEALPKQVKSDGRIHGNFNQSGTVTGRFSSNNPKRLGLTSVTA